MVQGSRGTDMAAADPKREAFLRLAERRTNAVLEKIRILTNCANPYAYSYEEADVRKMFAVIERELRIARAKFEQPRRRREFRLREEQR
jgi:hypothetical protein